LKKQNVGYRERGEECEAYTWRELRHGLEKVSENEAVNALGIDEAAVVDNPLFALFHELSNE
jgi:hypothetical protein